MRNFATKVVGESKNIFAKYDEFLIKRPLLTKCITSAGLSLGADLICQIGFSDEFANKLYGDIKIDWKRALKFTAIGGIFVAPTLHYWYGLLATKIPGTTMLDVLKRLSFDQLLFAPLFLPCFFSCALILDGTPELIPSKLKNDWLTTVVTNYAVWVPCQFINFKFMPPHHQVLFANIVGFFWNIYLSYACYNIPAATTTTLTSTDLPLLVTDTSSETTVVELAEERSSAATREEVRIVEKFDGAEEAPKTEQVVPTEELVASELIGGEEVEAKVDAAAEAQAEREPESDWVLVSEPSADNSAAEK